MRHYVYFIQQGTDGPIKIGVATDVTHRFETLQIGNPALLRILLTIEGTHLVERSLHRKFAHLYQRGEWFTPGSDLLEFIEQSRSGAVTVEPARPGAPYKTHCKNGHLLEGNRNAAGRCRECQKQRNQRHHYRQVHGEVSTNVTRFDASLCLYGHDLALESNRNLDGTCRICGNERAREYERQQAEIHQKQFPKDDLCAAELHVRDPDNLAADGSCKACSNATKQRWLDQNRDEWNTNRRLRRGSKTGKYATHCKNGHEFSGDNLYLNPKTKQRMCRACMNQRSKESKERKSLETQGELDGVVR